MSIRTNHIPRSILAGYELTESEREEFDYIAWEDEDGLFFRYKGQIYDLGEFSRVTDVQRNCHGFDNWDGYQSDSYFSAIVVKYVNDFESVIVGQFFC